MTDKQTAERMAMIREKLLKGEGTGHQIDIESQPVDQLPTIDEMVGEEKDQSLISCLELLMMFMHTPIVEDNFQTDDVQRDTWEKAVSELYGREGEKIINENRLRPNKLALVYSSLPMIAEIVGEEKGQTIIGIYRMLDNRPAQGLGLYKQLSNPEKRAIAKQYTLAAVVTMDILAGRPISPDHLDYIKSGYKKS